MKNKCFNIFLFQFITVSKWPSTLVSTYNSKLKYSMVKHFTGRTHMDCSWWSSRCYLDWKSQLRLGRQQNSHPGKWRQNTNGSQLQGGIWATQHWQCISCHCVPQWNGLHELLCSGMATHTAGLAAKDPSNTGWSATGLLQLCLSGDS